MTTEPVHFFLNPIAGRGRAAKRQSRILELLSGSGAEIDVHLSDAPGDLERQVFESASAGARRIVVAGGDGSIHEAVNGILNSGTGAALGVVPSGTGNDFAKACDIPLNWEHATRLLADRIEAEQAPRCVDAGICNGRYFANGAGVGFDAKVTRIARAIRLPIGDAVYLIAVFRAMLGGIATPVVRIGGDFDWDGPMTLVHLSNGPWVGGMFRIAPMAQNDDGGLELMLVKPVTRRRVLSLLPKLLDGTHVQAPEIEHRCVTGLTITSAEPIESQLDGEVQAPVTRFELRLLPAALHLL